MSSFGSPSPFFLAAGKKAYEVERSLRFNNDDNAYLSKTLSSDGNRTTMTLSVWLKRGNFGEMMILDAYENDANRTRLMIDAGNRMQFTTRLSGNTHQLIVTARQRDVSAWYHFVWAIDTTDSTASNRVKMYINGEQQTDFVGSPSYPDQNEGMMINKDVLHTIGIGQDSSGLEVPFDGYLAEINFIDGFQYDPSYFGETDVATGQWIPKEYTGSYGSKGFYLNFSDNSGTSSTTLGKDNSGNSNNYTPNNFSVAAGAGNDSVIDTPTNNFCTLNPLAMIVTGNVTPSNGNLDASFGSVSGGGGIAGTFAVSSGKWYWEVKITAVSSARIGIGVVDDAYTPSGGVAYYDPGVTSGSYGYINSGTKYNNATDASYGASYTTNDVIGVALDLDNGTITFYKNNSSQGQAFSGLTGGFSPAIGDGSSSGTHSISANFGQQGFTYTPPTGFKALNSANLPDPTIKLPNKHFDNLLYTGNGSTNNITGLNFSPDWVWGKTRNTAAVHYLFDQVRGANKYLDTQTDTETTNQTDLLTAFNSDGFTLGANAGSKQVNKNGNSYVAWNWDAGETDGKTYTVTVVSDSGNKYRFDGFGTSAVTLDLAEGGTYIFNYPSAHPFRFSTTSDGTHGGGSEYTTGVTVLSSTSVQIVVAASAPQLYYFCTQHSGMGGAINTNTTLGSSNFDGTIQSVVKASPIAGFSIVSFTGNATSGATVGHGLGVAPKVLIVKERGNTNNWVFYHQSLGSTGGGDTYVLFLDLNNDKGGGFAGGFNNTSPTSSVFSLGNSNETNRSSGNFITYCFSEVAGYSKAGSYSANGDSDGPFINLGFRPSIIFIKNADLGQPWVLMDNKINPHNLADTRLSPSSSAAEYTGGDNYIDILSNGFKVRSGSSTDINYSTSYPTHIYLAFAESPFKYARAR